MSEATHQPRVASGSVRGRLVSLPGEHLDARRPNNLPLELSSFVGREKELAEVKRLLEDTRLLTLTGSGGCGKTRLALAAAGKLLERYEDGVWLVDLAPLSDPDLVPQAVAPVLGVREQPGHSLIETISGYLGSKRVLLLLDNCEHLVEACAALAEALLRTSPELRVLATSREALGIAGEVAWPVPSLSLPDLRRLLDIESLPRYEAARLFVERASAVNPNFTLTEQNAPAVAQVCYRLDGIPLAIELAAARTKVLPVEQISEKLDDCFRLLSTGSRTAMPRHKTLHATMDWSHELLVRRSVRCSGASRFSPVVSRWKRRSRCARERNSSGTECWSRSRIWWISRWWWRGSETARRATACWRWCGSTVGRSCRSPGRRPRSGGGTLSSTWSLRKRPSRS